MFNINKECEGRSKNSYSKEDLFKILDKRNIEYKKHWTKKVLCDILRREEEESEEEEDEDDDENYWKQEFEKYSSYHKEHRERIEKKYRPKGSKNCDDYNLTELRHLATNVKNRWKMKKEEICEQMGFSPSKKSGSQKGKNKFSELDRSKECDDYTLTNLRHLAKNVSGRWRMSKEDICKQLGLKGEVKSVVRGQRGEKREKKKESIKLFDKHKIKNNITRMLNKLNISELEEEKLVFDVIESLTSKFDISEDKFELITDIINKARINTIKEKVKDYTKEHLKKNPDIMDLSDVQAEIASVFGVDISMDLFTKAEKYYKDFKKKRREYLKELEEKGEKKEEGICESTCDDPLFCPTEYKDFTKKFMNLPCIKNSKIKLKNYQLLPVKFFLDPKKHGLIVDHSTGTGKTISAVTISQCYLMNYPRGNVVVISPKSLIDNFKKEMKSYGLDITDKQYKFYTFQSFAKKYEDRDLDEFKSSLVIIDEAHNLSTEVVGLKKGIRSSVAINVCKKAKKVLLLTATPVKNRPSEIANLIAMVDGKDPLTKRMFNNIIVNDKTGKIVNKNEFDKYFKCKLSIFKCDKAEGYPQVEYKDKILEMDNDYYDDYYKIQQGQIEVKYKDLFNVEKNILKFHNGIRKAVNNLKKTEGPKIKWIVNKIEESVKKHEKILIFTNFIDAGMNLIIKQLDDKKIKYSFMSGDTSQENRSKAVSKFNPSPKQIKEKDYKMRKDEVDVLLVSRVGGEGLDLKGVRTLIIMEPSWNETSIEQIIGRGVRYLSHDYLPKDQQNITIYRLYMKKPDKLKKDDKLPSADILLRDLSLKKQKIIDSFMDKLVELSIENSDCK
jgi:SNF2 family DNA or RNA helicase